MSTNNNNDDDLEAATNNNARDHYSLCSRIAQMLLWPFKRLKAYIWDKRVKFSKRRARRRYVHREKKRVRADREYIELQRKEQQKYVENKQKRGALADLNDPDLARYLEDERIALFLQNEEFMLELRKNKDFMMSLEKDHRQLRRRRRPNYWSSSEEDSSDSDDSSDDEQGESLESPPEEVLGAFGYGKAMQQHDEDAVFKEKLKNMGKMSRKKFAQLARVFTGRKKRSAKQILSGGPAPSKDNLLLSAEPILVDDELDEGDGEDEKEPVLIDPPSSQPPAPPTSTMFSHQGPRQAGFTKLEGQ